MTNLTESEYYAWLALQLCEHHKRHCDGQTCNISLGSIKRMAEAAGATFTREQSQQFM